MRIEILEDIFKDAKKSGSDICVEIAIPNQDDTEFIINRNKSLDSKLEYYKKTYDKNCIHKNNNSIRIVSATPIDFICEI